MEQHFLFLCRRMAEWQALHLHSMARYREEAKEAREATPMSRLALKSLCVYV
jgi:hypothetical protein